MTNGAMQHVRARRTRAPFVAAAGVVLSIVGVLGYFLVVFRFGAVLPHVRNNALPNWILVEMGFLLSVFGLASAPRGRRRLPGVLLGTNLLVTGAFAGMLYGMWAVPHVDGPAIDAPAPPFALLDQDGRTVRLVDFHGSPLLLVFYRGHW
jgi:hypothetical protein